MQRIITSGVVGVGVHPFATHVAAFYEFAPNLGVGVAGIGGEVAVADELDGSGIFIDARVNLAGRQVLGRQERGVVIEEFCGPCGAFVIRGHEDAGTGEGKECIVTGCHESFEVGIGCHLPVFTISGAVDGVGVV